VINTIAYIESLGTLFPDPAHLSEASHDPEAYYVSEGEYHSLRLTMMEIESSMLRIFGFNLDVVLPYTLCITYLQALNIFTSEAPETSSELARRAIQHLNSSLQNPQLLYLTHHPPEIACAAIYLAARETGVKLPAGQWWEVFDCDREKLGFLVVAMRSMEGFVLAEKKKWHGKTMPLRRKAVEEMAREDVPRVDVPREDAG
jgi:cyclin L